MNKQRKNITIRCRVSKDFNNKLTKYCEENCTTKSTVMMKGIELITGIEEAQNDDE